MKKFNKRKDRKRRRREMLKRHADLSWWTSGGGAEGTRRYMDAAASAGVPMSFGEAAAKLHAESLRGLTLRGRLRPWATDLLIGFALLLFFVGLPVLFTWATGMHPHRNVPQEYLDPSMPEPDSGIPEVH